VKVLSLLKKKVKIESNLNISEEIDKDIKEGYEDEDNPCYICFVKGVCTELCDEFHQHGEYLKTIANKLAYRHANMVVRVMGTINGAGKPVSVDNVMTLFRDIEGKKARNIVEDESTFRVLKNCDYYLDRKERVWQNHHNKFGIELGGSSSCSSSSVSISTKTGTHVHSPSWVQQKSPPPKKLNQHLVRGNV